MLVASFSNQHHHPHPSAASVPIVHYAPLGKFPLSVFLSHAVLPLWWFICRFLRFPFSVLPLARSNLLALVHPPHAPPSYSCALIPSRAAMLFLCHHSCANTTIYAPLITPAPQPCTLDLSSMGPFILVVSGSTIHGAHCVI